MMKYFDNPNDIHQKIEKHFWEIFPNSFPNSRLIPKEIFTIKYYQLRDDKTQPNEFGIEISTIVEITDDSTKTLLDELDDGMKWSGLFKEVDYTCNKYLLLIGIKDKVVN